MLSTRWDNRHAVRLLPPRQRSPRRENPNILHSHSASSCRSTTSPRVAFTRPSLVARRLLSSVRATAAPKKSALFTKGTAATGILLFLLTISDPAVSAFETLGDEDENDSYWMDQLLSQNREGSGDDGEQSSHSANKDRVGHGAKAANILRNAHKHKHSAGNNGSNNPPDYSKIVIVGGGMAGLHTALALAERMSTGGDPPVAKQSQTIRPHAANIEKNAGHDIVVLDAARIGDGASGRAKGLVVPGFQVPLENLLENAADADAGASRRRWSVPGLVQWLCGTPPYTKAVVEDMYDLTYVALERLRAIVRTYGIACDWVESGAVEGSIHAAADATAPGGEEEVGEEEATGDDGCSTLTSAQVDAIMGRRAQGERQLYKGGEYDPSCAGVNPLLLTIGLAEAVESWGVRVFEQTKVTALEKCTPPSQTQPQHSNGRPGAGKYSVVTEHGHVIRCDHVVLCTGAGALSTQVSKRLSRAFVPVYTWMAATEPLHENCPLKRGAAEKVLSEAQHDTPNHRNPGDSGEQRPAPMCGDDHVALNYWRNDNRDEGRLLFGSLADTYPLPKWLISWRLKRALVEIYPQLHDVRLTHIWGGKLAFAPNAMPLIGRDTDFDAASDSLVATEDDGEGHRGKNVTAGGVWYATGFAGHGIVPTALAGGLLADAVLGTPGRQQWRLFHAHFPAAAWNGQPGARLGAGLVLGAYNAHDGLRKRGWPLPPLPKLW